MLTTYLYPKFPYRRSAEQKERRPARHPVVVIGAGPVGLTAALDLARRGVATVLLDDNDTVSVGSRAICFAKRPLEIWDRLGCAERMVGRGVKWKVGKTFFENDLCYVFDLLPEAGHKMPAMINLQQYYLEEYLIDVCANDPLIDLRWKHKVVGLKQDADRITLTVETPDGEFQTEADWVIACDGANSEPRWRGCRLRGPDRARCGTATVSWNQWFDAVAGHQLGRVARPGGRVAAAGHLRVVPDAEGPRARARRQAATHGRDRRACELGFLCAVGGFDATRSAARIHDVQGRHRAQPAGAVRAPFSGAGADGGRPRIVDAANDAFVHRRPTGRRIRTGSQSATFPLRKPARPNADPWAVPRRTGRRHSRRDRGDDGRRLRRRRDRAARLSAFAIGSDAGQARFEPQAQIEAALRTIAAFPRGAS